MQILGDDVDVFLRNAYGRPRSEFVRPPDCGVAQASRTRSKDVAGVRCSRHHHTFARCKAKGFGCGKVYTRLRLVVAGNFGAKDRVKLQIVAALEIDHQRNVGIRHRCHEEPASQLCEAIGNVRPSVETVPRQIQVLQDILGHILDLENGMRPERTSSIAG
jgi:hypothetical protein